VLRSVLLAASAGVAFGIASVFTKTVAVDWDWSAPLAQWSSLLVVAVLAIGGLLLSQASYRGAGLAAPLATVTVVNPVIAAAVGITMFGESFRGGIPGTLLALGFGALAAGGLILLTTERLAAGRNDADGSPAAGDADGRGPRDDRHAPGDDRSSQTPGTPMKAPEQRTPVSDRDAARPEVGEGIDIGSVARTRTDLEVEMRS
ncbi:hypothetical protein ACFQ6Q_39470, partial [Streptomyces sp. NPDC056437]